jgi:dTDP-4-amino-4,6-dideoxygalactose transaminase
MKIPFVDLYAQYISIKTEIDAAVSTTIKNSSYIGGQAVKDFEKAFAEFIGIDNVIACANGTDSLEILLQAYGIKKGDEVIVPALSWLSTSEAVSSVGATPVFVDIEKDFFTIDVNLIKKAITKKTKAIIPVHLYGHPANMPVIMEIANENNLIVIEDCAQAHGAKINKQTVGTFGNAASFSFYPGKNLGAYGDAGCMATNDELIAAKVRMIANHGQKGKHNHVIEGRNSRLDGLQAAILSAKLPHLEKWTETRISNAFIYDQLLQGSNLELPLSKENYRHVFHLYVVRISEREMLQKKLALAGIETAIHYPTALPFLPCYASKNYHHFEFPVAYSYQDKILSLPMFAELSKEQINYIANNIFSA